MNKKNLEILGLAEGATAADIKAAYETLREKYLEERFLDGEAGNNAAKMLNKIEVAYQELMNELSENAAADDGGASFARVEELIKADKIAEAQHVLDNFNERNAQWHYLQSVLFYKKRWMNESKKQLEIAIQLEPNNDKYKDAYRKLVEMINYDAQTHASASQAQNGYNSQYQGQNMEPSPEDQMGGSFCDSCLRCIACNMCLNCFCNGCCR